VNDESWQEYWRDNGDQLVWNYWLQKYPEYCDSCVHDSDYSAKREIVPVTSQLRVNESEVVASSECDFGSKSEKIVDSSQTCCLDDENFDSSQPVNCSDNVEIEESVDSNVNDSTQHDYVDSCTGSVLQHGPVNDMISDELTHNGSSPAADDHSAWNSLWEEHYGETYWYYHDWFKQWLEEEKSQSDSHTSDPACHMSNDVQHMDAETGQICDDLTLTSRTCSDCTAISQESMNIAESLLCELLLTALDTVDCPCPSDGNGQKCQRNGGKQHQHGLTGFLACHYYFHLSLNLFIL